MPVVLAIAASLRCFSCSAFHLASPAHDCFSGGDAPGNLARCKPCFALVDAVRHSGFGRVFAGFELRAHRLAFGRRLLWSDFGVLVARQRRAAFLLLAVGRADWHQLGLRCNGLGNMGIDLRVVAVWVGALCGIWANRKSFQLAPRRRAARMANTPFASKPPMHGKLRQSMSDSPCLHEMSAS
jgi:hypothetical protein